MESRRPSIPRDTRILLAVVLLSLSMLWVLARIRFPSRVQTPNPVPPVLAQFTPPSAFEDIAGTVAQVLPRVQPLLVAVDVRQTPAGAPPTIAAPIASALRIRSDLAVALIPSVREDANVAADNVANGEIARDPASRLALIRVRAADVPSVETWSPRRTASPRFLFAAEVSGSGIALRPVFIGALYPMPSAIWSASIWTLPGRADLESGAFLFTAEGLLAGLVVQQADRSAVIPGDAIIAMADRLARDGAKRLGRLGLEVQPLTPEVAAAVGSGAGIVVTWVDPGGPSSGQLRVGEVIERVNDQAVTTMEQWKARTGRVSDGELVTVRVRGRSEARDVHLTATGAEAAGPRLLGVTSRTIRSIGSEIVRVAPGTAAFRAGLKPGDVITLIGDVEAPTAAQLKRAFATAPVDRPLLAGVTRGDSHLVIALERQW